MPKKRNYNAQEPSLEDLIKEWGMIAEAPFVEGESEMKKTQILEKMRQKGKDNG